MRVAFLGATSGMGRALARRMAERGDRLFLLGRDPDQLARSGSDLAARAPDAAAPGAVFLDLERPDTFEPALEAAVQGLGELDAVVVTAAAFDLQERLEQDLEAARSLLTVNFAHTVLFCEQARRYLLDAGGGTLCVFSSVAGERGRKPVILYGAAKAGLSRYLEGLDHKFHAQGLTVICVKPGFVRTAMTEGLDAPPFAGEPEAVARQVLRAIDAKKPVVYTPPIWRVVMAVIRCLPRSVMRRVGF